jgi:hypothetical protein
LESWSFHGREDVNSPVTTAGSRTPWRAVSASVNGFKGVAARRPSTGVGTTSESSSATARPRDLIEAFEDPEVDADLSADAGDRTPEILPLFGPAPLLADPKPFSGY